MSGKIANCWSTYMVSYFLTQKAGLALAFARSIKFIGIQNPIFVKD
jgi:hypothetical protein